MKTALIALTIVAMSAVATGANAAVKPAPKVMDYSYTSKLDIAQVTQSPNLDFCGIRPVELPYQDHMNMAHTLRYLVNGNDCIGDN